MALSCGEADDHFWVASACMTSPSSWTRVALVVAKSSGLMLDCLPSRPVAARRPIKRCAIVSLGAYGLEGAALSDHGAQEGVFAA
jgi:hypothetical protein